MCRHTGPLSWPFGWGFKQVLRQRREQALAFKAVSNCAATSAALCGSCFACQETRDFLVLSIQERAIQRAIGEIVLQERISERNVQPGTVLGCTSFGKNSWRRFGQVHRSAATNESWSRLCSFFLFRQSLKTLWRWT